MAEFNREAIIKELNRISDLYDRKNDLEEQISQINDNVKEEQDQLLNSEIGELEEYQKSVNKNFGADIPKISTIGLTAPPPQKPDLGDSSKTEKNMKLGALCGLVFILSVIVYIIFMRIGIANQFSAFGKFLLSIGKVSVYIGFASGIGYCVFGRSIGKYTAWKKQHTNWETTLGSGVRVADEHFLMECDTFEQAFMRNVIDCTTHYNNKNAQFQLNSKEIADKWAEKLSSVNAELDNVKEQLDAVTLIHSDLFYSASHISTLLSTQRADTLKEAINLAIEEDRRDAQEAERRREARRQEAILEEQAFQTRMHEQAMERSAREHAAQMEAQARAQVEETERLRRAVEQQNRNATKH